MKEEVDWVAECVETNRWNPASVLAMLFKAITPEKERGGNPLLSCMMHWNVELIRQSNWLNICSCFIIILKWAFSLCMLGMPQCLLAFLIEAHWRVYISTDFNCTEIQVIRFKVKCSNFFFLSFVWTALKERVGELKVSWRERYSRWLEWKCSVTVLTESIQAEFSAEPGLQRDRQRGKALCSQCFQEYRSFHQLIFEQKDLPFWPHH